MRRLSDGVALRFKKRQVVRLKEDAPSGGPKAGSVGPVVGIRAGYPPLRGGPGKPSFYEVELMDARGTSLGRSTVEESLLEKAEGRQTTPGSPREAPGEEPSTTGAPVGESNVTTSPIGKRSSRFKRGDAVRLDTPLPPEGLAPAGRGHRGRDLGEPRAAHDLPGRVRGPRRRSARHHEGRRNALLSR